MDTMRPMPMAGATPRAQGELMPNWLAFLLYLAALVCFLLAAFAHTRPWATRVNLIALGLALWVTIPTWAALDRLD
jgi:hypothetical protein